MKNILLFAFGLILSLNVIAQTWYSEDFETVTPPAFPANITSVDVDGDGFEWGSTARDHFCQRKSHLLEPGEVQVRAEKTFPPWQRLSALPRVRRIHRRRQTRFFDPQSRGRGGGVAGRRPGRIPAGEADEFIGYAGTNT